MSYQLEYAFDGNGWELAHILFQLDKRGKSLYGGPPEKYGRDYNWWVVTVIGESRSPEYATPRFSWNSFEYAFQAFEGPFEGGYPLYSIPRFKRKKFPAKLTFYPRPPRKRIQWWY